MITLAVDASTYRGTVAVFDEARLLAEGSAAMRGRESELLMPAVDDALRAAQLRVSDIERVVCGAGPGSFTSLRIAASIAKGLAVGLDVPLYAVSSLALIVAANVDGLGSARYIARLDALRGESYVAEFEHAAGAVRLTKEVQLVANEQVSALAGPAVRVVGPAESDPWLPHVRGLPLIAESVFGKEPVNLAAWEPAYGRLAEAQVKWEAAHGRALQS